MASPVRPRERMLAGSVPSRGAATAVVVAACTLWYVVSFCTLVLNKWLLSANVVQPSELATIQMVSTAVLGALKHLLLDTRHPAAAQEPTEEELESLESGGKAGGGGQGGPLSAVRARVSLPSRTTLRDMTVVGLMRLATVVLGLVSLQFVAASFTETIKASAPFFTVIFAYCMLRETTPLPAAAFLLPVAAGLALASCTELSFNMIGFGAAVSTNCIECVQNVYSKRLLSRRYSATTLQFYTSAMAIIVQLPLWAAQAASGPAGGGIELVTESPPALAGGARWGVLLLDGFLYHVQSVVAYVVMSHLSPVSVSVLNTVKRALIILLSIGIFHNEVRAATFLGTGMCIAGAYGYNHAKQRGWGVQASASP